jgi:hypothetical protein
MTKPVDLRGADDAGRGGPHRLGRPGGQAHPGVGGPGRVLGRRRALPDHAAGAADARWWT